MKLFKKLIAAPAIISMATGFAVNAAEINTNDLSDYSNSNNLVSFNDFKSDTLYPGDWAYDSLKDLTNSPKFNGNSVSRLEAAAELNNLIVGGEGLMNGAAIDRLSDELGSELAIMKGRVDGLEARVNTIEAGSFSETTTMSGVAEFLLSAQERGADDEMQNAQLNYHWSVDLNTSFTGEDKLNVEISTGNQTARDKGYSGATTVAEVLDFGEPGGDDLGIEDLNYTFPLGEWTISVGDSMDASKNWPNACAVDNIVDALGDCGAANSVDLSGDVSLSVGRSFGDGWDFGFGISANDGEVATKGMFTSEGADYYGAAIGYSSDDYALTLAFSDKDSGSYYGVTAAYTPEAFPTISGGIEYGTPDFSTEDTTQYVVGISSDLGEGTLSAAYGTKSAYKDSETELFAYDVSYSYPVNDSMTIKPFVYVVEQTGDDDTGIGVITTFKF
jgi:hypothetical protein